MTEEYSTEKFLCETDIGELSFLTLPPRHNLMLTTLGQCFGKYEIVVTKSGIMKLHGENRVVELTSE